MKAVILAGGLGTRLRPLTTAIPKPLLPIGEQSLLEIQIINLAKTGVKEIYIATNYKASYIEKFIGDGSNYGVSVKFSKEDMPLGTCGPLSRLKNDLDKPFFVMNGDILSNIDFKRLYDFGMSQKTDFTVVTKNIRTPFNYGSVKVENNLIVNVEEKPDLLIEIVAGIYFMKPGILPLIPENTYFGINHLIEGMIKKGLPISRYLMNDYWLDIGRIDDYSQAEAAYKEYFDATMQGASEVKE